MVRPKSVVLNEFIITGILISIVCLVGCQTYQPKPLNSKSVQKSLKPPNWKDIKIAAENIHHPILEPIDIDLRDGLSAQEAAIIAVLVNPSLKAIRDERAIAAGQVIDAGLLPNPQLSYSLDVPSGGNTEGAINAYGLGVSWDINDLLTKRTKIKSASMNKKSVELDIAWQEWQVAESAKMGVYDILLLESQLNTAQSMEQLLKESYDLTKKAFDKEFVTLVEVSEAEIALQSVHTQVLELQKEIHKQKLLLNKSLGFPPDTTFTLQPDTSVIDSYQIPDPGELMKGLEERRLDLLALKKGYESQEANLQQAILEQFPKINLGVNKARDTGNVKTVGYGISIDLPFFNHNQGQIAIQKATRKKLYDEYVNRFFEARSDIYEIIADIHALTIQIHNEEEGIQKLQTLVNTYNKALSQGNIDIFIYYKTLNDLNDKKLEIFKSRQELQDLRIALEIAAGQYLN